MNILERLRPVLVCGLALLCVTAGTARADQKTVAMQGQQISRAGQKEDAKRLVMKARERILAELDRRFSLGVSPGKVDLQLLGGKCYGKYQDAIKKAGERVAFCLDNPGNKSPLDNFNALDNAQMIAFCESKGFGGPPLDLVACVDDVMKKELAWCEGFSRHEFDAAEAVKRKCLICEKLHDDLLEAQQKVIEAQQKFKAALCR